MTRQIQVRLRRGLRLSLRSAPGVHPADRFALAEVKKLRVRPGEKVLDLGCGCGVFGLAAARLGAGSVLMTDISAAAVRCSRANARLNRLEGKVRCRAGDFFSPCGSERFDLIIANLPQTPGPRCFHPGRWGGPAGTLHYERLAREAPLFLTPGGRIHFVLIGLADNRRVRTLFRRGFKLRCLFRMKRAFTPSDYDRMLPGLFDYLNRLKNRGRAEFFRSRSLRRWYWFYHRLFEAGRVR